MVHEEKLEIISQKNDKEKVFIELPLEPVSSCFPKVPAAGIPAAADSEGKGRNHDLLSPCTGAS